MNLKYQIWVSHNITIINLFKEDDLLLVQTVYILSEEPWSEIRSDNVEAFYEGVASYDLIAILKVTRFRIQSWFCRCNLGFTIWKLLSEGKRLWFYIILCNYALYTNISAKFSNGELSFDAEPVASYIKNLSDIYVWIGWKI